MGNIYQMESETENDRMVRERFEKLMEEFFEHWEGTDEERSIAFEGWALQKIAGLQIAMEMLSKSLNSLWRMVQSQ